jgi:hypothetical protein
MMCGNPQITQVSCTQHSIRGFPHFLDCWHQQSHECGENPDHYKQLDKGKR